MVAKIRYLLVTVTLASVLSLGVGQTALAVGYGESSYGTCEYQTDCPASATSGNAPNTGLERASLLWPIIAGIVGFSVISFVVIRYLNRGHRSK